MPGPVSGGVNFLPQQHALSGTSSKSSASECFGHHSVRITTPFNTDRPNFATTPNSRSLSEFSVSKTTGTPYLQQLSNASLDALVNAAVSNDDLDSLVEFAASTRPEEDIQDEMDAEGIVTNIDDFEEDTPPLAENPSQEAQSSKETASKSTLVKSEEGKENKNAKNVNFIEETTKWSSEERIENEISSSNVLYDAIQQQDYETFRLKLSEAGIDNPKKLRELTNELKKEKLLNTEIQAVLQQQAIEQLSDIINERLAQDIAESARPSNHETALQTGLSSINTYIEDTEQLKDYMNSEVLKKIPLSQLRAIGDQLGLEKTPQSKLKNEIAGLLVNDVAEKLEIIGELVLKDELAQRK